MITSGMFLQHALLPAIYRRYARGLRCMVLAMVVQTLPLRLLPAVCYSYELPGVEGARVDTISIFHVQRDNLNHAIDDTVTVLVLQFRTLRDA